MEIIKKESKKIEIIFLIILILATFLIRFHNTGELSGGDDSEYAQLAMHIIEQPLRAIYPSFPDEPMSYKNYKYNRPFAATPIVPFIFIFGYTITAVKLPSILFACLTVVVLFYLLKKQFNAKVAYLATILFAFLPFHIAFSRSGFLHSALTFYIILTIFLIVTYFEKKQPYLIYLAALTFLINILTTDFRGILPLLSLIPYIIVKTITIQHIKHINQGNVIQNILSLIKNYKHFIIAALLSIFLYFTYMLIPLILWNDPSYINWLKFIFIHSLGINHNYIYYKSFSENIILMGIYLILTPFIGLIFIPIVFGFLFAVSGIIKRIKLPEYILWISYLLVSLLYYINKQPYVERQVVFSPVYVTLAAIGIYLCYSKFIKHKSIFFPLLFGLSSIYLVLIIKLFPSIFGLNIQNINRMVLLFNIIDNYFYSILIIICILTLVGILIINLTNNKIMIKKTAIVAISIFLLVNLFASFFLVYLGIGIFKRPEAVKIISDFLKENTQDVKYSCLAYNEDKSITFYTKKICANYKMVNVTWIKEQVDQGNLKYFVFNLYQKLVGPGLESRADISKYFPEQYEWIMNNTVDVTEKTGLAKDNPYFKVREYITIS